MPRYYSTWVVLMFVKGFWQIVTENFYNGEYVQNQMIMGC
jgi:hypothetical protein